MNNYFDIDGGPHHIRTRPDPDYPEYAHRESSENPSWILGLYIRAKFENKALNFTHCLNAISFLESLVFGMIPGYDGYKGPDYQWKTTSISKKYESSQDEWKGRWAIILTIEEWCVIELVNLYKGAWSVNQVTNVKNLISKCEKLREKMPVFHKQLDHPRDFSLAIRFKHPVLYYLMILPPLFVFGAAIVSCWQTHERGNKEQWEFWKANTGDVKSDGPLSVWMVTKSFKMRFTFWLCNKITLKRYRKPGYPKGKDNFYYKIINNKRGNPIDTKEWYWRNWANVSREWFQAAGWDHPVVKEFKLIGKK